MKTKMMIMALIAVSLASCGDDDNGQSVAPSEAFVAIQNTDMPIADAAYGCNTAAVPVATLSELNIGNEGVISDPSKVSVTLELEHSWSGDLIVELVAPNGSSIPLIKRIGSTNTDSAGDSANFAAGSFLTFNTASSTELPFAVLESDDFYETGSYKPTGSDLSHPLNVTMSDLADFFNAKEIQGDWKIRINDYCADDSGMLISWKLNFEEGALN